jgi:hypothetical protein
MCIQVGGSDEYDRRAGFSSYGPGLDLVAPGLDIWSTFLTYPSDAGASYPGYAPWAGTSFSAPCVTGTVGLLVSVRPELIDTDFAHVLRESAHDIGAPGVDAQTGWGRLDAAAALDAVGPGMGIWHDEVAGQSFRSLGFDTLDVGEGGFGSLSHWTGRHLAELIEATATVTLPDSFLGPVRVWPRVGGTTTVRGGFRLPYFAPWAEVVEWAPTGSSLPAGARSFTLRGYLYRLPAADCAGCGDADLPLPADQMRFGFTVLGPVDRPPVLSLLAPAAGDTLAPGQALDVRWSASDPDQVTRIDVDLVQDGRAPLALARLPGSATGTIVDIPCAAWPGPARLRVTARDDVVGPPERTSADLALRIRATDCNGGPGARLALSPNPSAGPARISGPAGTRVTIYDLSGRRVREAVLDTGGAWAWDGRDEAGRELGPGIYFARAGASTRLAKLVRIR